VHRRCRFELIEEHSASHLIAVAQPTTIQLQPALGRFQRGGRLDSSISMTPAPHAGRTGPVATASQHVEPAHQLFTRPARPVCADRVPRFDAGRSCAAGGLATSITVHTQAPGHHRCRQPHSGPQVTAAPSMSRGALGWGTRKWLQTADGGWPWASHSRWTLDNGQRTIQERHPSPAPPSTPQHAPSVSQPTSNITPLAP
jgi:hypothetical protein